MIETLHLFRPLNAKLLDLLRSLSNDEWCRKTVAGNWTVKDVVAHLLDTNMRFISIYRDHASLAPDRELNSYADVVAYLNELNTDWVKAMKRVSGRQLIELHESTHEDYIRGLESLDPQAPAMFSVAWAGEIVSTNWF
ncbi:MAG TPA: maleylpyruvate isomerase N-terminal domain-containing protein, partial [Cyclobacteriaceae bacterium]|nr:maleylpyruvate isomerase N-terminal domain-containing protein [Cyclobacteriaceae bacterium]